MDVIAVAHAKHRAVFDRLRHALRYYLQIQMLGRCACACLVVAACTSESTSSESTPPFYGIFVEVQTSPARPTADGPFVYIDGQRTSTLAVPYPDGASMGAGSNLIELRYGDVVVAAYNTARNQAGASAACDGFGDLVSLRNSFAAYMNGSIDYLGTTADCTDGGGGGAIGTVGGGDCAPCSPGEQCSIRATLVEPLFSTAACAPIGPKQLGDACTWIADPGGAYSDCGADLLCAYGTCHARCPVPSGTFASCACEYVEGMPYADWVCSGLGDRAPN